MGILISIRKAGDRVMVVFIPSVFLYLLQTTTIR